MEQTQFEELFKDRSKEEISAFAYNIGRMLEAQVKLKSKRAEDELKDLRAKVMSYKAMLPEIIKVDLNTAFLNFDSHFNIYNEDMPSIDKP